MKAIILTKPGSVDNLLFRDIAVPVVAADKVLMKVDSISINPVDTQTGKGGGI